MCFITNDFFGNPELDQQAPKNQLNQVIREVNNRNLGQQHRFVSALKTPLLSERIEIITKQLQDRFAINRKTIDILGPDYTIRNDEDLANFINNPKVHSPQRSVFLDLLHPHQRALFLTQLILLEDIKLTPFCELDDISFTVIFLSLVLTRDNHNGNIEEIIDDYILLLTTLGKPNDPRNNCIFATRELPAYQSQDGKKILIEIYKKCLLLIT